MIRAAPAVRFHEVSFSYGEKAVLRGASFQVAAGEHVALLEKAARARSTILTLLLGFAAAQAGAISIDGRGLSDLDAAQWRRALGLAAAAADDLPWHASR